MITLLVSQQHALRSKTEAFIRSAYEREFGAHVEAFPARILAMLDTQGEIISAAGIRSSEDGFFSESYLDGPIEERLAMFACKPVSRNAVVEVSTLVTRAPSVAVSFIRQIIEFGEISGFEWVFFTLTKRLRGLLSRMELELRALGAADKTRIQNADSWGRYYETQPQVYAVERGCVSDYISTLDRAAVNA